MKIYEKLEYSGVIWGFAAALADNCGQMNPEFLN